MKYKVNDKVIISETNIKARVYSIDPNDCNIPYEVINSTGYRYWVWESEIELFIPWWRKLCDFLFKIKCPKCGKRYRYLYSWDKVFWCNPCITKEVNK